MQDLYQFIFSTLQRPLPLTNCDPWVLIILFEQLNFLTPTYKALVSVIECIQEVLLLVELIVSK
jgi:hypothetical protein